MRRIFGIEITNTEQLRRRLESMKDEFIGTKGIEDYNAFMRKIDEMENKQNGAKMKYTIVSATEADLRAGKLSVETPIAKGLLGKKVGGLLVFYADERLARSFSGNDTIKIKFEVDTCSPTSSIFRFLPLQD